MKGALSTAANPLPSAAFGGVAGPARTGSCCAASFRGRPGFLPVPPGLFTGLGAASEAASFLGRPTFFPAGFGAAAAVAQAGSGFGAPAATMEVVLNLQSRKLLEAR